MRIVLLREKLKIKVNKKSNKINNSIIINRIRNNSLILYKYKRNRNNKNKKNNCNKIHSNNKIAIAIY